MTAEFGMPSPRLSPVDMISFAAGNFFHHSTASSISARVGFVGSDESFNAYDGITKHPGLEGGESSIIQNRWIIFPIKKTLKANPPPNTTIQLSNPHIEILLSYLGEVPKAEGVLFQNPIQIIQKRLHRLEDLDRMRTERRR